ncbi:MAG: polymer-forming cytoskeletal protein [Planctomycetota bacterium]
MKIQKSDPIQAMFERPERGSAAVVALVAVTVLVGLGGAMLMIASRSNTEGTAGVTRHQAKAGAQAGLARALNLVAAGEDAALGTQEAPLPFGGGSVYVEAETDDTAGLVTLRSYSQVRGESEALEALLAGAGSDIYDHALFAGNTSGSTTYQLKLGGSGVQADKVTGDVYSGGGVTVSGTASVDGTIRADGTITGASGETDVSQPVPDIAAMNYPVNADYKVADLFALSSYKTNALGGKAWQLPESSPAHIFRKNPSDRASNTSATAKDDYFLEDPYEPVKTDSGSNGSDACPISLAGIGGEPGTNANHKVYYIDGNLWIHNKITYSFQIQHDLANGVQVTFVAKGNIYFSDNLFYDNTGKDGVAFIAMKDSTVSDSGNIYFGDPVFGTLEAMHAFMYAENNFYDNNLSASGSAKVAVYGNMTAGNQVAINRDYGSQHSKLTVNYDGRIAAGSLDMPGLPGTDGMGGDAPELQAVRRIAKP